MEKYGICAKLRHETADARIWNNCAKPVFLGWTANALNNYDIKVPERVQTFTG